MKRSYLLFLIPLLFSSCGGAVPSTPVEDQKVLNIVHEPYKTTYYQYESLDLSGLEVENKSTHELVTDYATSMNDGDVLSTLGEFSITVSKENYQSTSFDITVLKDLELTIYQRPYKTTYKIGETLDLSGLLVKYGETLVFDYQTSLDESYRFDEAGEVEISVTRNRSLVKFTVEVNDEELVNTSRNFAIYYMNDTHGAFSRQNTESNYNEGGMEYISTFLRDKKKNDVDNTIILSGGDMFQGGYESNSTRGDIMIDAMNIIDFDAMTLGNHEFDWGEYYLSGFPNKLNCPLLSCNTFYSSDNVTRPEYLLPYTIIEKAGLRIGVISGEIPNMGVDITGSISQNFYFPSSIDIVKSYSDTLRSEFDCDLIIGSFHDGNPDTYTELCNVSSVTNKKYIDGLFLAHDHRVKYGNINGVQYLESGCNGRYVGEMHFTLNYQDDEYVVTNSYTRSNATYQNFTVKDEDVASLREKYKDLIIDPDKVLTTLSRDYTKAEFAALVARAMMYYVNNNPEQFDNTHVYFSSHNVGGIRVNMIEAGDLTLAKLTTIMPFDNEICIQRCTSNHLQYMRQDDYYATAEEDVIVYSGIATHAVTISYIAENTSYNSRYQLSFVKYDSVTSKDCLINYLLEGVEDL